MIRYTEAPDITHKVRQLAAALEMNHLKLDRVFCIRSYGSASRGIIARCHALPKIMQQCLDMGPAYIVEILSERFDKMSEDEKVKTLIHELLHIPKAFGGGFKGHGFVTRAKVERFFVKFKKCQNSPPILAPTTVDRKV